MAPALFVRSLVSRTVHMDAYDHHPYSVGGPTRKALNPDDVSVPDLGKLTRPVRAAWRAGRVLPKGHVPPLWITEFSWDSSPPDPQGVPMRTLARWVPQTLRAFDRAGVRTALWYQVDDQLPTPSYAATYQSGLYFADGRPKLIQQAFRFPFTASRRGARVAVWLRAPGRRHGDRGAARR